MPLPLTQFYPVSSYFLCFCSKYSTHSLCANARMFSLSNVRDQVSNPGGIIRSSDSVTIRCRSYYVSTGVQCEGQTSCGLRPPRLCVPICYQCATDPRHSVYLYPPCLLVPSISSSPPCIPFSPYMFSLSLLLSGCIILSV